MNSSSADTSSCNRKSSQIISHGQCTITQSKSTKNSSASGQKSPPEIVDSKRANTRSTVFANIKGSITDITSSEDSSEGEIKKVSPGISSGKSGNIQSTLLAKSSSSTDITSSQDSSGSSEGIKSTAFANIKGSITDITSSSEDDSEIKKCSPGISNGKSAHIQSALFAKNTYSNDIKSSENNSNTEKKSSSDNKNANTLVTLSGATFTSSNDITRSVGEKKSPPSGVPDDKNTNSKKILPSKNSSSTNIRSYEENSPSEKKLPPEISGNKISDILITLSPDSASPEGRTASTQKSPRPKSVKNRYTLYVKTSSSSDSSSSEDGSDSDVKSSQNVSDGTISANIQSMLSTNNNAISTAEDSSVSNVKLSADVSDGKSAKSKGTLSVNNGSSSDGGSSSETSSNSENLTLEISVRKTTITQRKSVKGSLSSSGNSTSSNVSSGSNISNANTSNIQTKLSSKKCYSTDSTSSEDSFNTELSQLGLSASEKENFKIVKYFKSFSRAVITDIIENSLNTIKAHPDGKSSHDISVDKSAFIQKYSGNIYVDKQRADGTFQLLNSNLVSRLQTGDGDVKFEYDLHDHFSTLVNNLNILHNEEIMLDTTIRSESGNAKRFHKALLVGYNPLLLSFLPESEILDIELRQLSKESLEILHQFVYQYKKDNDETADLSVSQQNIFDLLGINIETWNPVTLSENLIDLLKTNNIQKLTIKTTDCKLVTVHIALLVASSPYFKEKIATGILDGCLELDVTSKTMDIIVQFIYTARMNLNQHCVSDVFLASCKFQLPAVHDACTKFLCELLRPDYCKHVLRLASLGRQCNQHFGGDLYSAGVKYIAKNFNKVSKEGEFLLLSVSEMKSVIQDENLSSDFDNAIQSLLSILKWSKNNEIRISSLSDILIHFPLENIVTSTFKLIAEDVNNLQDLSSIMNKAINKRILSGNMSILHETLDRSLSDLMSTLSKSTDKVTPLNNIPVMGESSLKEICPVKQPGKQRWHTTVNTSAGTFKSPVPKRKLVTDSDYIPTRSNLKRRKIEALLKRNGDPDLRYKENKELWVKQKVAKLDIPLKKNGEPDRRFKVYKQFVSKLMKNTLSGKPDMRFKENKNPDASAASSHLSSYYSGTGASSGKYFSGAFH